MKLLSLEDSFNIPKIEISLNPEQIKRQFLVRHIIQTAGFLAVVGGFLAVIALVLWSIQPCNIFDVLFGRPSGCLRTFRVAGWRQGDAVSIAFSPDGKLLVSGNSDDGKVMLWNTETGKRESISTGVLYEIDYVGFSPDGQIIAAGDQDRLFLWDVTTRQKLQRFIGRNFVFSNDGRYIALVNGWAHLQQIQIVGIWDVTTGHHITSYSLPSLDQQVAALIFAPDNNLLVLTENSTYNIARVYEITLSGEARVLKRADDQGSITPAAFSPDGNKVALSDWYEVIIWDLTTGQLRKLGRHSDLVRGVAFSPDGQTLVSVGSDHILKFWDIASGELRKSIDRRISWLGLPDNHFPMPIAYSVDGKKMAVEFYWNGAIELLTVR